MTDRALLNATEIATLKSWRPLVQIEDDGWTLTANGGAIGRLNSVAITGTSFDAFPDKIARAERFFHAHNVAPAFRLVDALTPSALCDTLLAHGFRGETVDQLIMARDCDVRLAPTAFTEVRIAEEQNESWRAVFEGEGFASEDSRQRAQTYARSPGLAYAVALQKGAPAAAGLAAMYEGVCGLHGMRTSPAARGQGFATALIAAMAQHARAQGATGLFLHVLESNQNAVRLYRKLGFATIARYRYWRKAP